MTWRVATSLETLKAEVDAFAPGRSVASDGAIGDAAHASRDSDHNPWVIDALGIGVVRARDFTHDPDGGLDCNVLAERLAALLGTHPALGPGAYVIWNRRIMSTNRHAEGWREYTGTNPHDHHCHLSVCEAAPGYDSDETWKISEGSDMPITNEDADRIIERLLRRTITPEGELNVQQALRQAAHADDVEKRLTALPDELAEQVMAAVEADDGSQLTKAKVREAAEAAMRKVLREQD